LLPNVVQNAHDMTLRLEKVSQAKVYENPEFLLRRSHFRLFWHEGEPFRGLRWRDELAVVLEQLSGTVSHFEADLGGVL
jgi:hypothetical protein